MTAKITSTARRAGSRRPGRAAAASSPPWRQQQPGGPPVAVRNLQLECLVGRNPGQVVCKKLVRRQHQPTGLGEVIEEVWQDSAVDDLSLAGIRLCLQLRQQAARLVERPTVGGDQIARLALLRGVHRGQPKDGIPRSRFGLGPVTLGWREPIDLAAKGLLGDPRGRLERQDLQFQSLLQRLDGVVSVGPFDTPNGSSDPSAASAATGS